MVASMVALTLWICGVCCLSTHAVKDQPAMRLVAVLLFALTGPIVGAHTVYILGEPKAVEYTYNLPNPIPVISYKLVENQAIYVYVNREGAPLSLRLPWSTSTARELMEADKATKNGDEGTLMLRQGEEGDERMFYSQPHRDGAPKT